MEKFSNLLFDMVATIVGAATGESGGYPVRLIEALKGTFGRVLSFGDSLLAKLNGTAE